jgi:tetratricopeptide (TPR) repeat protein
MTMTTPRIFATGLLLAGLLGCASKPQFFSPKLSDQSHKEALSYKDQAEKAEKIHDYDNAIVLNQKAIALEPDMGAAWNNLGLDLMRRGHPDDFVDAAQAFKRAADLLPSDDRPYQNLGVLYSDRGFSEEALRYFCLALERNPNSLESLRGAIGATKLLHRSDEAGLTRLNRALMMESDHRWREIMEFEKMRIQQDLTDRSKPAG